MKVALALSTVLAALALGGCGQIADETPAPVEQVDPVLVGEWCSPTDPVEHLTITINDITDDWVSGCPIVEYSHLDAEYSNISRIEAHCGSEPELYVSVSAADTLRLHDRNPPFEVEKEYGRCPTTE